MKRSASYLFVPATDHMMRKAFGFPADAIIFDLEDSIKETEKEDALNRLVAFLFNNMNHEQAVYVRLNADRLSWEIEKLKSVNDCIDGIMIPKAEDATLIRSLDYSGEILALIETPQGMICLPELAKEPSVTMILFGAEDYTSITGMANDEDLLLPLKSEIVKYAKANNKKCIDTVSKEFRDEDAFRKSAKRSKELGFDGKLLIHPLQVGITNSVFMVDDIEKKKKILEAFKNCDDGVLKYEGTIYELPHIEMIRREIAQYDQK